MTPACRISLAFALAAVLAGCDNPKPRDPPPPLPLPMGENAPTPFADRLPAWSRELVGKPLASAFPEAAAICVGNTDNLQARLPDSAGVEIVGWGWDPAAKAPIARILIVGPDGLVAGAGEPGVARPDVTAARPDVTAPDTGWSALTSRTQGPVDAYGVIADGKAICRLGRLDLG